MKTLIKTRKQMHKHWKTYPKIKKNRSKTVQNKKNQEQSLGPYEFEGDPVAVEVCDVSAML